MIFPKFIVEKYHFFKNIQATLNLSRDVDQIDRSFDSDVILTQVRRPNTLPPEVIAIMDEPANMTQRTITQQNAEIVSNLAGTSISKEVCSMVELLPLISSLSYFRKCLNTNFKILTRRRHWWYFLPFELV